MEKFEEMKIKHQLKDAEHLKKNLSSKLKSLEADIDVMKSYKEWGQNKHDIHASLDMDEERRQEIEKKIKTIMKERNLISRERKERIKKMWDEIESKEKMKEREREEERLRVLEERKEKIKQHIEFFEERQRNKDNEKKEFEDMIKTIGKTPETIKKIEKKYKEQVKIFFIFIFLLENILV
jgi:DNA repair exonuclease SbcCD ATPase subunit